MDKNRKHFILDIEATGPSMNDMILEIGILELDWVNDYWIAGRAYHKLFGYHLSKREMTHFAMEHQQELYNECENVSEWYTPSRVRQSILDFFEVCGCKEREQVKLMGWDVASHDLPMLRNSLYLQHKKIETDKNGKETIIGDYNFIIYEIGGAFKLAQDILGLDEKTLMKKASEAYDFPMPGKATPNRAIYDCYSEAKLLNGLIKLIREFQYVD